MGAGTDTIVTSDDATVVDADFTLVSNVEAISYRCPGSDLTSERWQMAGYRTVTFTDEGRPVIRSLSELIHFSHYGRLDDNTAGSVVNAAAYVGPA